MKKPIACSLMKLGILFFVTLIFQTAFVQASGASEATPFYKSWLIERGYTHPALRPASKSPAVKKTTQTKAVTSAKIPTSKMNNAQFWKSWLQERSYAHPAIKSRAAVSIPVKNISKAASTGAGKRSVPKYKSRPEYNVCNFVCLSTCKSCKKSSSNYLLSRE